MDVFKLFDLSDQVAIVTGGGRGLGRAMAEAFLEAGARVVLASRKRSVVEDTAAQFAERGFEVMALPLDVTDASQVDAVVSAVVRRWGRVDVLVNNSGASWGTPVLDMPLEAWAKVMSVNATGTFLMTQRTAQEMKAQGGGRIINIASIAGLAGTDPRVMDAAGYSASKGAIIALTRDLSRKLGPYNIHVNAIAPGFIPTKMSAGVLAAYGERIREAVPLGRLGTVDDLKGVALLLASRASDYMTGSVIVVDGGTIA